MKPNGSEKDWSLHCLVGVEHVPPNLTISFKNPTAVHVDVFATQQEEASCILEVEFKSVLFPVAGFVRESDAALDVYINV